MFSVAFVLSSSSNLFWLHCVDCKNERDSAASQSRRQKVESYYHPFSLFSFFYWHAMLILILSFMVFVFLLIVASLLAASCLRSLFIFFFFNFFRANIADKQICWLGGQLVKSAWINSQIQKTKQKRKKLVWVVIAHLWLLCYQVFLRFSSFLDWFSRNDQIIGWIPFGRALICMPLHVSHAQIRVKPHPSGLSAKYPCIYGHKCILICVRVCVCVVGFY